MPPHTAVRHDATANQPFALVQAMMTTFLSSARAPRLVPLAGSLLLALLTGCTLQPTYQRPDSPVAQQWPATPSANGKTAAAEDSQSAAQTPWQDLFADAKLRETIQLALDNNRDLRVAVLNIEQARAQYRIQRAALVPHVSATGSYSATRVPQSVSSSGSEYIGREATLGVGISAYELDLFGRVRSLKDQALETYLATEETRRATHISLISEVANAYLTLAADMDLQKLAHDTLQTRQDSYDLQTLRAQVGNASQVDLKQTEEELEAARADALSADANVATARNALELLVGKQLPAEDLPVPGSLANMLAVHDIPADLPSNLLQNRPDILAAEHSLRGANANIGAARAAFFPSISLTTSIGRQSPGLTSLFDRGNNTWSFAPQINVPIFNGGELSAELDVAKISRDIYVAQYEKSIQTAFREVADALAQRAVIDEQYKAQDRRTQAAQAAYDLVKFRYDNGVASHLDVLDAQRTLNTAQQSVISAQLSQQTSIVTLYQTLGGGWQTRAGSTDSVTAYSGQSSPSR
jgi:multidrug efflux system outer membrane protein